MIRSQVPNSFGKARVTVRLLLTRYIQLLVLQWLLEITSTVYAVTVSYGACEQLLVSGYGKARRLHWNAHAGLQGSLCEMGTVSLSVTTGAS